MGRGIHAAGYCLLCFHSPLDESDRCSACGHVSLPSQRREFWTLRPRYLALERIFKVLAFLTLPVGCVSMLAISPGGGGGPSAGWSFAIQLCLAVSLWKTAEKWTRHSPYFRPYLVWCLSLAGMGILFLFKSPVIGLSLLGAAGAVAAVCQRATRWKRALIASGAAQKETPEDVDC